VIDVARLPRTTLTAGTQLYRIHRSGNGPWYFDGSGDGRFDPAGTPGRGSCYWAEDPLGAWVEVFRTRMVLTPDDLVERRLTELTLEADVRLPDLTNRQALRAGVTTAVTAGADYTDSQALADSLQGVDEGIRWRLRHDLEQLLIGVALFGNEGPATRRSRKHLPRSRTRPIPVSLVKAAIAAFRYEVLAPPVS
jgi:RES domain